MKRIFFFIATLSFLGAIGVQAEGPTGFCTSTTSFLLTTSPISQLTCSSVTIAAYATPHCNALTSGNGYRFVITNGSHSVTSIEDTSYWSGTCSDLKCGYNEIKAYYRESLSGPWLEYAVGGITLEDCDF